MLAQGVLAPRLGRPCSTPGPQTSTACSSQPVPANFDCPTPGSCPARSQAPEGYLGLSPGAEPHPFGPGRPHQQGLECTPWSEGAPTAWQKLRAAVGSPRLPEESPLGSPPTHSLRETSHGPTGGSLIGRLTNQCRTSSHPGREERHTENAPTSKPEGTRQVFWHFGR